MDALENFDWKRLEQADVRLELLDKIVGSYIPMPDGSQHYVEIPMYAWYWLRRMHTSESEFKSFAQETLDAIAEADLETESQYTGDEWNAEFQHVYQTLIMAKARGLQQGYEDHNIPLFG